MLYHFVCIQSEESEEERHDDGLGGLENFGDYDSEYGQGNKKKKKKRHLDMFKKKDDVNEADIESLYTADPSK